jgi:hypothetical protein
VAARSRGGAAGHRPADRRPTGRRYFVDPVGLAVPLFNAPPPEPSITSLAREFEVPAPLRRRALYDELEARRADGADEPRWFGDEPVFEVWADTGAGLAVVPLGELTVADLSDPPAPTGTGWPRPVAPLTVAVDPVLGRLAFRAGLVPTAVEVTATVATPGHVGAGSYERDTILPDRHPTAASRGSAPSVGSPTRCPGSSAPPSPRRSPTGRRSPPGRSA